MWTEAEYVTVPSRSVGIYCWADPDWQVAGTVAGLMKQRQQSLLIGKAQWHRRILADGSPGEMVRSRATEDMFFFPTGKHHRTTSESTMKWLIILLPPQGKRYLMSK